MEGGREEANYGRVVGRGGREGGRVERKEGAMEEAMTLCRERASVEEGRVEGGRVDEGNERGRDERDMDCAREGGSERRMD